MAYITLNQARNASRSSFGSRSVAETKLVKSAAAPMSTHYDVFLSHSYEDAEVISGLKSMIEEGEGLIVYVDWVDDSQVDRSKVTPENAELLRQRMRHCRFLLFASSKSSPSSRWMPWELGYFDGLKADHVGVLPLVEASTTSFQGQEYLGLYPRYELIDFTDVGRRIGRHTVPGKGETLEHDVLA